MPYYSENMLTALQNETLKPQKYRLCVEENRTHIASIPMNYNNIAYFILSSQLSECKKFEYNILQ